MKIDKLTLQAGVDIPLPELKVNIHQPTIREIALLGEERFYKYLALFDIGREQMRKALLATLGGTEIEGAEDLVKSALGNTSDFEVFMQVVGGDSEAKLGVETILQLMMPNHKFEFEERIILGMSATHGIISIDENGFALLKEVINVIFCLNQTKQQDFNPANDKAQEIADKIKKARERVRTLKGESQEERPSILANYLSSLSIGANAINLLTAVDLTVWQLFNQMQRFGLYTQSEHAIKVALAGAKDVEMIDWLQGL